MNKKITLIEAISIGIGGMVGGGIFAVLGEAVMLGHSSTPISFLIAGIIALLTSYSYAKLSVSYPSEGGTVTFLNKAFGINLLSKSLNIILWISYLVTISLYALAFGSYSAIFFPDYMQGKLLTHLLITLAILIPMILNMLSAKIVAMAESYIVGIKIGILLLVTAFGIFYIEPSHFSGITNIKPFSMVIAGMMIFVAYEGFELIANSAKEIENPEKNLPRAYYISVIFVIILYILIAMITVGTLTEPEIIKSSDYALAEATKPALGMFGFKLVAISAILATFSAINATLYGNARLGYSLAIDRELPNALHRIIWNGSYQGVLIVGGLSILMANTINLSSISIIASAGFLMIFSFVNLSALKMNKEIGAKKIITLISTIFSSIALFILLFETYEKNKQAIYLFILFIIFAAIFESTYGKTKDDFLGIINKAKNHFKRVYFKIIRKN